IKAPRTTTDNMAMTNTITGRTPATRPITTATRVSMLRRPRRFQATRTNAHRCQALGITGWTVTGISLVDDTRGSVAIGCFRRTQGGTGLLRGIPAGVSSWDSGVAHG